VPSIKRYICRTRKRRGKAAPSIGFGFADPSAEPA
jgi:hypothetical protein